MKPILLPICILFISFCSFAQNGPKERMKAFKVAYITEKLSLTSEEAQQFWPIYNSHDKTLDELKRRKRKMLKVIKQADNESVELSDKQAGDFLTTHIELEEQKSLSRKKMITDLKKIISNKKILKLIRAEADFHKRILDKVRERRKKN